MTMLQWHGFGLLLLQLMLLILMKLPRPSSTLSHGMRGQLSTSILWAPPPPPHPPSCCECWGFLFPRVGGIIWAESCDAMIGAVIPFSTDRASIKPIWEVLAIIACSLYSIVCSFLASWILEDVENPE
jgi:hypothetical protein